MKVLTKVIVVRDFHAWLSPAVPGVDVYDNRCKITRTGHFEADLSTERLTT